MGSLVFGAISRLRAIVRFTRGQSLVELALVLPVLLLLVLAAVDLGRIFFARIAVSNAAREGAYEASYNGTYVAGAACAANNSVMCAILNEAQSSLSIAPTDVTWSCTGGGGCATGAYGDRVTITVNGHFTLLTPILAVFFGGTNVVFSSTAAADIVSTPFTGAVSTAAPTVTPVPTPSPIPTPSQIVTIPPGPTISPTPSAPTCNLPTVNFTWTQQNKNRPVVFDGTSSSPTSGSCQITFWRWEYGAPDNTTDAGVLPTVSHDFALDGQTYVVTLTVTNARGTIFIQKNVTTAG